mmetsp:Transcript_7709/g.24724  ORF Transcript_7709/g.24724 Transcript_7709/m.24724 type:complete len:216 (-) Transcript_7709:65-712(-)
MSGFSLATSLLDITLQRERNSERDRERNDNRDRDDDLVNWSNVLGERGEEENEVEEEVDDVSPPSSSLSLPSLSLTDIATSSLSSLSSSLVTKRTKKTMSNLLASEREQESDDLARRYATLRSAKVPPLLLSRVLSSHTTGTELQQKGATLALLGGSLKLMVAEVTEVALALRRRKRGRAGPLSGDEVREAYALLRRAGAIPYDVPPLFKRSRRS